MDQLYTIQLIKTIIAGLVEVPELTFYMESVSVVIGSPEIILKADSEIGKILRKLPSREIL